MPTDSIASGYQAESKDPSGCAISPSPSPLSRLFLVLPHSRNRASSESSLESTSRTAVEYLIPQRVGSRRLKLMMMMLQIATPAEDGAQLVFCEFVIVAVCSADAATEIISVHIARGWGHHGSAVKLSGVSCWSFFYRSHINTTLSFY